MNSSIEQQNFPDSSSAPEVFASDPTATIERPENPHYTNGVDIGYTAPAKWWNWLWNHISAWFATSKTDKNSMHTELLNVLSAASITPDATKSNQLSKAVDTIGYSECVDYDNEMVTEEVGGVMVTHKANQPYVIGHTLYIPDTELL